MLHSLSFSAKDLFAQVQQAFGMSVHSLDEVDGGADANAWAFRIVSESGEAFFLKVRSRWRETGESAGQGRKEGRQLAGQFLPGSVVEIAHQTCDMSREGAA